MTGTIVLATSIARLLCGDVVYVCDVISDVTSAVRTSAVDLSFLSSHVIKFLLNKLYSLQIFITHTHRFSLVIYLSSIMIDEISMSFSLSHSRIAGVSRIAHETTYQIELIAGFDVINKYHLRTPKK